MRHHVVPSLLLLATALASEEVITITAPLEDATRLGVALSAPNADTGSSLSRLPGIDAIRMGAVGLDPVVRGQSASRVLVIADGACPHGGCPNRMDPPANYAPADADLVVTQPGGLSIREPGAPLGIVRLEREAMAFAAGEWIHAKASTHYGSNGNAREAKALLAAGCPGGFFKVNALAARADDYHDGSGDEIHSSYRKSKAGVAAGWTPGDATRIELSHDLTRERDVAYAGAGMDGVFSDDATTRLRSRYTGEGRLASLEFDLYRSQVEHLMDNYSLRQAVGMLMRTPTTSDTAGGRLAAALLSDIGLVGLGLDGEDLRQDARRYSGASATSVTTLNSVLWPDARIRRMGVWADLSIGIGETTRLIPGIRYDNVRSDAGDATVDPPMMPMSPAAMYASYYGADADARTEHLYGIAVRCERDWGRNGGLTVALSRQQRAADPTERFIASNGMTPSARWVGNPALDAETHNQIQVSVGQGSGHDRWHVEAWFDRVEDYIRRDRARGQETVRLADGATVYYNGEASLSGVRGEGELTITPWLDISSDAALNIGQDLDSNRPLPQIPPFSGRSGARVHGDAWQARVSLRWAARATRVDDDISAGSGLDAGETPFWLVADLQAVWSPRPWSELSLGIDNLFDRTYADHLNKPSLFDTTVVRVNEPGRNVWVSASITF